MVDSSHLESRSGAPHMVRHGRAVSIDHHEDWENGSRRWTNSRRESPWSDANQTAAVRALITECDMSVNDAHRALATVLKAWEGA